MQLFRSECAKFVERVLNGSNHLLLVNSAVNVRYNDIFRFFDFFTKLSIYAIKRENKKLIVNEFYHERGLGRIYHLKTTISRKIATF